MSSPLRLKRIRLVTVEGISTDSSAPMVSGPADAAKAAGAILPTDREGFVVLHLDSRHRIRSMELVSVGSLNASIIHPRETFKAAILANAESIVISHNHPSGDPTPSDDDLRITRRLVKAGELLGIEVIDHVIVAGGTHMSFQERGLL